MKARITTLALVAFGALTLTGLAIAGGPLVSFGDADVTVSKNASAHIVVGSGESGGVYRNQTPTKLLKKVKLSFISTGDVGGGAPRWSIPVSTDNDATTTEGYAFLDAAGCGATVGDNPTSIPTLVSTKVATCKVNFLGVDYANWKALVAAFPTARTAKAVSFVIADVPGDYFVTRVTS